MQQRSARSWGASDDGGGSGGVAPGKRTRTMAIQCKAAPAGAGLLAEESASVGPAPDMLDGILPGGQGAPLPADLQGSFAASVGASLDDVRVHTGAGSAQAARSLGALAFTAGNDIHFADGQYDPGSESGRRLLAHEVAHTVQQGGASPSVQRKHIGATDDPLEHQADAAADAMLAGRPAQISAGTAAAGLISLWADPAAAGAVISIIDGADVPALQRVMIGLEQARAAHGTGEGMAIVRIEDTWEGTVDGRDLLDLESRTRARFRRLSAPAHPHRHGHHAPNHSSAQHDDDDGGEVHASGLGSRIWNGLRSMVGGAPQPAAPNPNDDMAGDQATARAAAEDYMNQVRNAETQAARAIERLQRAAQAQTGQPTRETAGELRDAHAEVQRLRVASRQLLEDRGAGGGRHIRITSALDLDSTDGRVDGAQRAINRDLARGVEAAETQLRRTVDTLEQAIDGAEDAYRSAGMSVPRARPRTPMEQRLADAREYARRAAQLERDAARAIERLDEAVARRNSGFPEAADHIERVRNEMNELRERIASARRGAARNAEIQGITRGEELENAMEIQQAQQPGAYTAEEQAAAQQLARDITARSAEVQAADATLERAFETLEEVRTYGDEAAALAREGARIPMRRGGGGGGGGNNGGTPPPEDPPPGGGGGGGPRGGARTAPPATEPVLEGPPVEPAPAGPRPWTQPVGPGGRAPQWTAADLPTAGTLRFIGFASRMLTGLALFGTVLQAHEFVQQMEAPPIDFYRLPAGTRVQISLTSHEHAGEIGTVVIEGPHHYLQFDDGSRVELFSNEA